MDPHPVPAPHPRRAAQAMALATVFLLVGCGGGGTGPVNDDDPGGDDPQRVILANPAFAANIQEIFDRRGCAASGCHGDAAEAGLRLTSGASYADLVDVAATSEAFLRVAPGDPENSYLVIRIEGRQAVGSRMPLNGAPLDNIDRTNIRNWIANGAPNN